MNGDKGEENFNLEINMNNIPEHIKKKLGMYQSQNSDDTWDTISRTADIFDEVLNESGLDAFDINYVLAIAQMDALTVDFGLEFDEQTHNDFMDEYMDLIQKYMDKGLPPE